jgi:Flp pilus assembly protein TadD
VAIDSVGVMSRSRSRWTAIPILIFVSVFSALAGLAAEPEAPPPRPVRRADAACAKCHERIFRQYLETPMAKGSGTALENFIPGAALHAASGMRYQIGLLHGQPTLSYAATDNSTLQGQYPLLYYLGSGNLGVTYLYSMNGYLLESPVAYYSAAKRYDMAPGRGGVTRMPSAMPMNALCMRCHMSGVQSPLPGAGNHFAGLPFLNGGITCERCHGDATRHVASNGKVAVLNPAKLEPAARDSVCYSCHLEGDTSVVHRGRSLLAFKPGDRIGDYVSYFVLRQGSTDRSVSEIEQLSVSQCKRMSGDRMSCTSCHDPHSRPSPEERVAFYRSKCLACHNQPAFAASHFPATPDCTTCHMPKIGAVDTPHVAWTDHRILKTPQSVALTPAATAGAQLYPVLNDRSGGTRELALAYYNLLLKGHREYAGTARDLLTQARQSDPADPSVLIALASLDQMQGHPLDAEPLYSQGLRLDPDNVEAANDLAMLLTRSGKVEEALPLWRHAFEIDEDSESLGLNLAIGDCLLGLREDAEHVLNRVLVYNPASEAARKRLKALSSGDQTCSGWPAESAPGR